MHKQNKPEKKVCEMSFTTFYTLITGTLMSLVASGAMKMKGMKRGVQFIPVDRKECVRFIDQQLTAAKKKSKRAPKK